MHGKKVFGIVLALLLVSVMAFALAACNNDSTDQTGGGTPGGETPGGETPGGETPGGETPGGGEQPVAEWEFAQPGALVGYEVTGYNGTATEAVIPSTHEGEDVVRIADGAFKGNTSVTSVTIPVTVIEINGEAFSGCTALTEVVYQGTLRQWYEQVVRHDDWYDGATFETVTCSDGVYDVDEAYFTRGLSFTLNDEGSGYIVSGLNFDVNAYPSDPTTDTVVISAVYMGKPVVEIAELVSAGSHASNPKEIVKTVTVKGNNLKVVGRQAFYEWGALESVTLPDSVETIGEKAFFKVGALTEIYLPASLKEIGKQAFYQCTALATIRFGGTTADWKNITPGSLWKTLVPAKTVTCSNGTVTL